jgi:hypothetical protein
MPKGNFAGTAATCLHLGRQRTLLTVVTKRRFKGNCDSRPHTMKRPPAVQCGRKAVRWSRHYQASTDRFVLHTGHGL